MKELINLKKILFTLLILLLTVTCFGCSNATNKVKAKVSTIELTSEPYAIAIAKENVQLKEQVNDFITELKDTGELENIINSYFGGGNNFSYLNPANKEGCLILTTNAYFPPFEYYNGNKFAGIDIELAYLFATRLGKTLYIEDMDFSGVIGSVQNGNCDMAMAGLTVSNDRLEVVAFSISYYTSSQVLVLNEYNNEFDNCNTATDVENILKSKDKNYKIGMQNGTTGYMYIAGDSGFGYEGFTNLSAVGFTTGALAIKDLLNGKLDAVVLDSEPAKEIVEALNSSTLKAFFNKFISEKGYKLTLEGLKNTIIISILGLLIGFLLGAILATVKIAPVDNGVIKFFKVLTQGYVTVIRGTPILVQLLLCHFAIFPALGIDISYVAEAVIVYGLNSSAYMAEAIRSGINSVDKGQMEAGRALGFSFIQTMIKIVLPQAVKNVIPTLGNEFIALIKETSVANLIAVTDLTRSFTAIAESTYDYFIPYIVLALIYLVIIIFIAWLIKLFERRMNRDVK